MIALILMLLLVACGGGEEVEDATVDAAVDAAVDATEEPAGPVDILWYGTAPQTVLDEVAIQFNNRHDDIKLTALFQRGPELAQKVEAEAAAGKGEACLIMHPIISILDDFRDRGLLMEYHSPEEAAYPDWFIEPGWWIGVRVLDVPLVYNTDLITEAPDSWEILADPAYKDQIAFTDAGTIGGPPILTYKLLKEEFGDEFWPQVAANDPFIREQTGQVLEQLLNGEIAIGWMYGYNALLALRANPDAPLDMVWVKPTTMFAAFNALLSGCPNPEQAMVVFDWLASQEGQQVIADTNRTMHARSDVDLGPGRIPFDDIPWVAVDMDEFSAQEEELKAEWRQVFGRE
jgi:iron(III) transport system substrate-binding protein